MKQTLQTLKIKQKQLLDTYCKSKNPNPDVKAEYDFTRGQIHALSWVNKTL